MSLNFNDNIKVSANKPIDFKFGPFESIAQANSFIPESQRYTGLTFGVLTNPESISTSDIVVYYYFGDLSDTSIKQKNVHNLTSGLQGGSENERYHLTLDQLVKLDNITQNTSPNGLINFGTVVFSSPTSATVDDFEWRINDVNYSANSVVLTTNGTPTTYPRPDYFIGTAAGTVVYRPSIIDQFGNSVPPIVSSNEVLLVVVQRNTNGTNTVQPPSSVESSPFPEDLFQTATQAGTQGLYAKVWEATAVVDNTYILSLEYGSPSAEDDWTLDPAGRTGSVKMIFLLKAGIPITGSQLYTVDTNSEPGDWVLIRSGSTLSLYHRSRTFWMRAYYRVLLVAGGANKTQILNQQPYAALPSYDQIFESESLSVGSGIQSVTGDGVDNTDPDNPVITQYPEAVASTAIDWSKPKTFGSFGTPLTGTLTQSNTGAKRVVQVIFYSGASFTAPDASWKLSANSADYATSGVNIIYVEYFSDTYKRYWFDQDV